jgi:SAM-dependent methyltransferase
MSVDGAEKVIYFKSGQNNRVQLILCPKCQQPLVSDSKKLRCREGDQFLITDGIIDLMPDVTDSDLIKEEKHFDNVFKEGKANFAIGVNTYISTKMFQESHDLYKKVITKEWPDFSRKEVYIGEIACGDGSAIRYFSDFGFSKVNYIGADISIKSLQAAKKVRLPYNWNIQFVRTSVNVQLFKESSLDIVFSIAALHHLKLDSVIEWVSKSLKPNGLFVLTEPSYRNPLAKVGRRMVHGFHTEGERSIDPQEAREIADRNQLDLMFERGLDFMNGPLCFFPPLIKLPKLLTILSYHITHPVDLCIRSPTWSYRFIQVYRKK